MIKSYPINFFLKGLFKNVPEVHLERFALCSQSKLSTHSQEYLHFLNIATTTKL